MFSNRRNSQKPREELIAEFRAAFPGLSSSGRSASASAIADSLPSTTQSSTSLNALDVAVSSRHLGDEHEIKDLDPTPRANVDQWRFTPSLLDPNSYAFSSFANQPPGYYTPTPGGTNTIYHSQAGDLHTPGYAMGLGTPLSLPTSEASMQVGQPPPSSAHQFNPQVMAPHLFQNPNPFAYQPQMHQAQDHQSYAPHQYAHQQAFDQFQHVDQPKLQSYGLDIDMQEQSQMEHMHPHQQAVESMDLPVVQSMVLPPLEKYVWDDQSSKFWLEEAWALANMGSNFRYHSTLNAPTAMIKHPDEIPVTYLNKGQSYTITVIDTRAVNLGGTVPTYRTFVRVSFEDDQQRLRPAQCWQLWKEGRGTNEAHHRGGKLQAVEFVDPNQTSGLEPDAKPKFEVESESFDGFCVKWSPVQHGSAECAIPVRFNFLSTDFSHSKGVKGIPVRLCAKTQLVTMEIPMTPSAGEAEVCFCKVKLFRDHGAERKLSNDVAHVKKSIDKLKQQISQTESGVKDYGKRKPSELIGKPGSALKPGKVPKHKRTWSLSSTMSDNGTKGDDDLHAKLAALQDMFTSTRPASVLFLKGEDVDDPDLHPVRIIEGLQRVDTGDSATWEKQSTNTSSIISPSASPHSGEPGSSTFQRATPLHSGSRVGSNDWQSAPQTATGDLHPGPMNPPDVPIKVQKSHSTEPLPEWIDAIGVDFAYHPPPERIINPVACIYIKPQISNRQPTDGYYRAVYLMQRTLSDLINGIALKSDIDRSSVLRSIHVNSKGLQILIDDDMVNEINEGQDMIAEFRVIKSSVPMKREWDSGPADIQVDGEVDATGTTSQTEGYELILHF